MNTKVEIKMIEWFDDHFYKVVYLNEQGVEVVDYLPSITTKLGALHKPWLSKWRGTVGNTEADRIMRESADEGSLLHWAWYTITTGGAVLYQHPRTPTYTQEQLNAIYEQYHGNVVKVNTQYQMWTMLRLQDWWKIVGPKSVESELILYDLENRDSGTADNFMYINEGNYMINGAKPLSLPTGMYVVDLKTGKTVDDVAKMQLSAYAKMYEKTHDANIEGALIIHTQSSTRKGIENLSTIHVDKDGIDQYYSDYRDIARVWDRNFGTKKPIIRDIPTVIALTPEAKA